MLAERISYVLLELLPEYLSYILFELHVTRYEQ